MSSNNNRSIVHRLIGTRRLKSFHIETSDGKVTYHFGRDAVGYYIFTESG